MRTLSVIFARKGALLAATAACALLALAGPAAPAGAVNKGKLLLLPGLPNPGHEFASARAISGNGQTVVGVSSSPDTYDGPDGLHAVTWGSNLLAVDIGSIGGNVRNEAEANAISFDGKVIAGGSTIEPVASGSGSSPFHAFVFAASATADGVGTFTDLGTLAGKYGYSSAFGLSGDGKVAVGETDVSVEDCECSSPVHAFRWTRAGGMTDLGTLEKSLYGDFGTAAAYATNSDGSFTVGVSSVNPSSGGRSLAPDGRGARLASYGSYTHAVYWSGTSAPVDLGTLNGPYGNSQALAVNAQATALDAKIVGSSIVDIEAADGTFNQATLWTLKNGAVSLTNLGTIENYSGDSVAKAISAPGTIIVGNSDTASGQHAFRWSKSEGMQDLNTLLTAVGVDLGAMVLTEANGISADGQFIVGTAEPAASTLRRRDGLAAGLLAPSSPVTQGYIARYVSAANVGGVTTSDSVYGSVDALAGGRQGQIVTSRVLASVLQGINEQVNCSNCVSVFGAVGSFSAGIHGRYSLSDRLTLLAGGAFAQFSQDGVEVRSAPILAAALRYDLVDWGASRPFFEAGATASPNQDVRYSRHYANGAGIATGVGSTRVDNYAVYGRVGWVNRFAPADEIAASAEVWSGWQHVRGYSEAFNQQNPFEATVQGGTDRMNLVKLGAQWTHLFGANVEFNVNGGIVRSFGSKTGVNANIPGFGTVTPLIRDQTWVEAGARISYRFSKFAVLDLFANGSSGAKPIGTHVHGGAGLRLNF